MKKKILVTAIASVLIAPAAFAAEGSDGMTYTSASEGFYGSLRARFDTGNEDGDDSTITTGGTSVVGVRGTLDMGAGLTGFYQWETKIDGIQGGGTGLRQRHVGIRGAFGEVRAGSFTDPMIGVSGHTDVTNSVSGNFDLSPGNSYRVDQAISYTTPDLNGFQASARIISKNITVNDLNKDNGLQKEADLKAPDDSTLTEKNKTKTDTNAVDDWAINASYSVQGLTAVAGYRVETDGLAAYPATPSDYGKDGQPGGDTTTGDRKDDSFKKKDQGDAKSWGAGLGYGQDNWNIGFWYGETENQGVTAATARVGTDPKDAAYVAHALGTENNEDTEIFSVAGNVTVGKVQLMAFTETAENVKGVKGDDDTVSGVGIQYSFTANSKVWMDYQANDKDSVDDEDDKVVIGLRHDF